MDPSTGKPKWYHVTMTEEGRKAYKVQRQTFGYMLKAEEGRVLLLIGKYWTEGLTTEQARARFKDPKPVTGNGSMGKTRQQEVEADFLWALHR